MKIAAFVSLVCLSAQCRATNPIQKVLELMAGLQSKVLEDGETAQQLYETFATECKDRSVELRQGIKTAQSLEENQKATIEQAATAIQTAASEIEEISAATAKNEADLKAATEVRTKEAADFAAEDKELASTISTLNRAIFIVEKEMSKGGSFVQTSAASLTETFSAFIDASSLSSADASTLTALLQSTQSADSDLDDGANLLSAPDATAYESHSSGLVETFEGLLDKAQTQLEGVRQSEESQKSSYDLLKQSLEDKISNAEKDLDRVKANKGKNEETKATTEKHLAKTQKNIEIDSRALDDLHHGCMARAADFEEETTSRGEELKAIVEAKKIIEETSSGAESAAYGSSAASFLEVRQQKVHLPAAMSVLHTIRQLARKRQSKILTQLAVRAEKVLRGSHKLSGKDVFEKVKGLINNLIAKLQDEAGAEAAKKSYCDKEMSGTNAKQDDQKAEVEKTTSKIDKMTSDSVRLAKEITVVQNELVELVGTQAEMDKIRTKEEAVFKKTKTDLEQGISGVQAALKVLRDYYAVGSDHGSAEGAGSSIIGLLEVCESDFAKGLSIVETDEDAAKHEYEVQSKDNSVLKASKEQDKTYKTKEVKSLEKAITEYASDRTTSQQELDAVNEYMAKLTEECVAKPEPYEERKRRREQEIAGLQQALETLSADEQDGGSESLIQEGSRRHALRGFHHHVMH